MSERHPWSRSRPFDWRWSLLAIFLILVELVVAVAARQVVPGSGRTAGAMTPYEQLFAQVRPDGTVSKDVALQAFALAIAPLPGVNPPAGAPTPLYERADGTFAIDWLRPYMDQLSPDQKAAVDAALAPDPSVPLQTPTVTSRSAPLFELAAQLPLQEQLTVMAHDASNKIAAKLGRPLDLAWAVITNQSETKVNGGAALAYTYPIYDRVTKIASQCLIHVNPSTYNSTEGALISATVAHEMFHCFQNAWLSDHGRMGIGAPDWIIEGQAEWAGEAIGGPSSVGQGWWEAYLDNPGSVLWQEGYQAVGFYQRLLEDGTSPWTVFDGMLQAWTNLSSTPNEDAYKVAGANTSGFLDTWAPGFYEDLSLGTPQWIWDTEGPWDTTEHAKAAEVPVANGEARSATAAPVTNTIWTVVPTADILQVQATGHVRLHVTNSVPELPADGRWLCFKDGGCQCPQGTIPNVPPLEDMSLSGAGAKSAEFGITGGLSGASVTVVGHSLDEYCAHPPTIHPPAGPCKTDCPDSNGDPHLRTTNDYRYDFQGAGEFVLLRNTDGSIEIQGREEPYGNSRAVAVNTAIAIRDNGHRIGIYASASGRMQVKVDGVGAGGTTDLGAGASVHPFAKGIEVDFPDGSILWALSLGSWGIDAMIQPSDALRAQGAGLLGPITPGNLGVPALPDGTIMPIAPDAHTRFQQVYGPFADAWRVTDATSLFDYGPGQSTATFTDRSFPNEIDEAALASPDPGAQAAAQTACAAITDPELQPECIFDVAATGDAGFADQYAAQQDLYDSGIATPPPPSASASVSSPGMHDAVKVTDLASLMGAAVGPDDTVYLSIDDGAGNAQILAVDPRTAAVLQSTTVRVSTDLHFAAGSLWAAGLNLDSNFQDCNATRFDPATLAVQATFPLECSFNYPGPKLVSSGDTVWVVDTTNYDLNSDSGAKLAEIDPNSNTPGQTVGLLTNYGGFSDSQGALFCHCGQGNSDIYRLMSGGSSLEDLGNYPDLYPAGTGIWSAAPAGGDTAVYVNGGGGPAASVTLAPTDTLVGGDAGNAYVQREADVNQPATQLLRQPADGSAAVPIANAPTWDSPADLDYTSFDYLTGNPTRFATPDGFVTMWIYQGSLYLQWAPIK